MAIQSFQLDPNAQAYTDNEIVTKVNGASNSITRANSVAAAARPIIAGEVSNTELAGGAAKANLDAMAATARGYIQTAPLSGEYPVIALQRDSGGNLDIDYDDVPI